MTPTKRPLDAAMLWNMPHHHSDPEWFGFTAEGGIHLGSFFIIDDRLITVSAAGRKRTVELGHTPPLALAENVAAELFLAMAHETAAATK